MHEYLIILGLVGMVAAAGWALVRRARRGCYPSDTATSPSGSARLSMHAPPLSMDIVLPDPQSAYWHYESRPPVQPRLDTALKRSLRGMSDEDLRAVRFTVTDKEAWRLRKLEMDRRSRKNRRRQAALRKSCAEICSAFADNTDNVVNNMERCLAGMPTGALWRTKMPNKRQRKKNSVREMRAVQAHVTKQLKQVLAAAKGRTAQRELLKSEAESFFRRLLEAERLPTWPNYQNVRVTHDGYGTYRVSYAVDDIAGWGANSRPWDVAADNSTHMEVR